MIIRSFVWPTWTLLCLLPALGFQAIYGDSFAQGQWRIVHENAFQDFEEAAASMSVAIRVYSETKVIVNEDRVHW